MAAHMLNFMKCMRENFNMVTWPSDFILLPLPCQYSVWPSFFLSYVFTFDTCEANRHKEIVTKCKKHFNSYPPPPSCSYASVFRPCGLFRLQLNLSFPLTMDVPISLRTSRLWLKSVFAVNFHKIFKCIYKISSLVFMYPYSCLSTWSVIWIYSLWF
jgi:hypothetical protein